MKRRYHVLSVVSTLAFGGDENRLVSIVSSLDPQQFRFSVVTLPQASQDVCGVRPVLDSSHIPIHQLSDPQTPAFLPSRIRTFVCLLFRIWAVARLARECAADLIDARLDGGMLVGIPAAILARKPSVVTLYEGRPWAGYTFWRIARGVLLNLTNAVITDSAVRESELARWIVRPSGRTWNIPNGIQAPEPSRPRADVANELSIPGEPGTRVIAQISSIVPYKGHLVLLEAARKVFDSYPKAFFLLIGYSRHYPNYRQQVLERIKELGMSGRVQVHAYPGPIGDIWQLVDIHVHASLFDSLPNAILEAMALGRPSVVTSVGGIPAAVEHEKTGLVVPANNVDALARALLRLLNDPKRAAEFGEAARRQHATRYQPGCMAKGLQDCYFSVLSPLKGTTGAPDEER